ncbi:MAG: accessory factor UbiK family protein [Burkholderiaceae bacterium]
MADQDSASRSSARPPFGFGDLPDRMLEMLRASPAGEIEKHLRAGLQQGIERLDLVTREEFEVQRDMVERLRARVEALEARLAELEHRGDEEA